TIIYDAPIRVAENVVGDDSTLAIRVTKDDFCNKLIRRFRRPIVSTSANISGAKTPSSFTEIAPDISEKVDYVVNLRRNQQSARPSAIIKLGSDGKVGIVRK